MVDQNTNTGNNNGSKQTKNNTPNKKYVRDKSIRKRINRRALLRYGAATATAATVPTVSMAQTDQQNIADAGADPDGNNAIDSVLDSLAEPGGTIHFPPGEYLVSGSINYSYDGLKLVGENATILPASGGGSIVRMGGSNWTVDGFEFDFRSVDRPPRLYLEGRDWLFANTVFRGTQHPDNDLLIFPSVPSGSEGEIRRCYLHEGAADPDDGAGTKAMWSSSIDGTLRLTGMWLEHWAENCLYLSNNPGRIVMDSCFFRNNNVGQRVTSPAEFRNCVFVKDGPVPYQIRDGGGTGRYVRGIWWNAEKGRFSGNISVKNCDFIWTDSSSAGPMFEATDGRGGTLRIEGCNIHNETSAPVVLSEGHTVDTIDTSITGNSDMRGNFGIRDIRSDRQADPTPPIPQPPEIGTAPGGDTSSGGPVSQLDNTLVIDGSGSMGTASYMFTVDGQLRGTDKNENDDSTSSRTAVGTVTDGTDSYEFSGNIVDFSLTGDATLRLNGNAVNIDGIEAADAGIDAVWKSDASNRIGLSSSTRERKQYEIVVKGTVEPGPMANLNDDTDVLTQTGDNQYTISGLLEGGTDNWDVTGHVVSVTTDSGIDITVNGQSFPAAYVEGIGPAPTDGNTSDGTTDGSTSDGSTNSTDTHSNQTESSLAAWKDGETNRIGLSSSTRERKQYEIVVKGTVEPGPMANLNDDTDVLTQTGDNQYTISGLLEGGTDNWDVTGHVVSVTTDSGIDVTVNGESVTSNNLEGAGTVKFANTIVIQGSSEETSMYSFSVSGTLIAHPNSGTLESDDIVSNGTAEGEVNTDADAYSFSGTLQSLQVDGTATLSFQSN